MTDYVHIERVLTGTLGLRRRPVAVTVRDAAPAGVEPFSGTVPSGCSFWTLAANGRTFSTVPADHYNCPVGSYTHNIPLPPEREPELMQTLNLMTEIGYLRMEEVPGIPHLPATPGVVIYAPLAETPVDPDAVVIAGPPAGLMLLHEAAARSNIAIQPLFGRPTCMAIPASLNQTLVSSIGCIGNRIYTELPDSNLYTVIAGRQIGSVADQLETIAKANAALADYHRERRVTLTADR
jgi:uncharacterized protein (DUF169 family)